MNGQPISSADEQPPKVISDEQNIKYSEKKKMSLTLPLLNVVLMNTVSDDDDTTVLSEKELKDSVNLDVANAASKKKKIYESDDTFIQTIFSQTIKSTTATPTEDEPVPDFDDFKKSSTSKQNPIEPTENIHVTSDETCNTSDETKNDTTELNSQEPAAVYTYFHQTIEEDDSPDIDITACNPDNTLTTTISTQKSHKTQTIICTEFKDDFSEKDQSLDNSLNNTSTACASNGPIDESEQSLTQLNSFESDVSVLLTSVDVRYSTLD